jgi:uncharacterized protein YodC (DUF2158 family)
MEVGDVVELKSGSPKMTIQSFRWDAGKGVNDKEVVLCTWFQDEELVSEYFNVSALKIS